MTQVETETRTGFTVAHLDDVERQGGWIRIRKHFGVGAFGINAYRPNDDGELVSEHDEKELGHEELYAVLEGHATFTLDGDDVDAPAGTLVFVRDPAVRRRAVAVEPQTTILAVGAAPGKVHQVSPWEENADVIPLFGEGRYEEAKRYLQLLLERYPEHPGMTYNLACAEARLGETDAAMTHLEEAMERDSRFSEYARTDEDLASLRDDPRFPA